MKKILTLFLSLVMMLMCLSSLASCKKKTVQINDLIQRHSDAEKIFDRSKGYEIVTKIENNGLFANLASERFPTITYTYGSKNNIYWIFDDTGYPGKILVPYDIENGLYDSFIQVDYDKKDTWEDDAYFLTNETRNETEGIKYYYTGTLTPNQMNVLLSDWNNADRWLFDIDVNTIASYIGEDIVADKNCKIYELTTDTPIVNFAYSYSCSSITYKFYVDNEFGLILKWIAAGTARETDFVESQLEENQSNTNDINKKEITASFEILDFKLGDDVEIPEMDLPVVTDNERYYDGDYIPEEQWMANAYLSQMPYSWELAPAVVNITKGNVYSLLCLKIDYDIAKNYIDNTLKELFPDCEITFTGNEIYFSCVTQTDKVTVSFEPVERYSGYDDYDCFKIRIGGILTFRFEPLEVESETSTEEATTESTAETDTTPVKSDI